MTSETRHRKTIRHYDGELDARSLTFSCFHRLPFLAKDYTREWMLQAIELGRQKHPIHVWAYVVMPEHIHLLVWPFQATFKVEQLLTTVKQSVAKKALNHLRRNNPSYLNRLNGSFHFWQDGPGYDRNLYSARTIWTEIDYIHNNPLRRNLVTDPLAWRWSSAGAHYGASDIALRLDIESLPDDPRR
jgi:putative transposase